MTDTATGAAQGRVVSGRYTLVREVGRGGMGAVWLAHDTVLGREVAMKRVGLMPGTGSSDLQRAEREARLAARLNHPHVVAVFDLVEGEDESWLVMEYVEGITLSAFVSQQGALRPDQAAPLLTQAADALAAAHEAGIVHRDVKPSNMLVDSSGQVKLSDFGIARAEADASLTVTGLVTGSPAYLAPEVASGATATEAADVWSLGATLFHLLAGHPPYDVSENLMGALYRIVHEEPPRLASATAGRLAEVLEHTMAHDPADRWSMAEVRDFLAASDGVPVHPTPVGALTEDGTRVWQPTPSAPVAVPPVPLGADPGEPLRRVQGTPSWAWLAAAAALLVVGAVVAAVISGVHPGTASPSATPPPAHRPSPTSPTHSAGGAAASRTSGTSAGAAQAASMRSFVTTYLATVTSDQHRSWAMLTRDFQRQSGGFGRYRGFWRTIRSATPRHVVADPSGMRVSYGVDYVLADGAHTVDHVTLDLVRNGSAYLISGES